MKSFVTAMSIALIIVIGGIAFNICINDLSDELIDTCEKITEHLNDRDFSAASKQILEMSEFIDRKKLIFASVLNHENIDEIELCVSELQGYTDSKYLVEALVRCKKLKHLFEHLPSNYRVTMHNIL
ncbi:MAG: DUF4363 family protein [Firmicutes bacterium]|nr:DUF4363 family protein [Bacillota bacterium]